MYDIIEKTLSGLKKYHVNPVILSPKRWATYTNKTPLSWVVVRFEKTEEVSIPEDRRGVYSFVVKPGIAEYPESTYLLYVGKAEDQSLRQRFVQYFYERNARKGRPKVQRMLQLWEYHLWFCYTTIEDTDQIHGIEQSLIGAYIPPMNDQYPAEIRPAMKAWG